MSDRCMQQCSNLMNFYENVHEISMPNERLLQAARCFVEVLAQDPDCNAPVLEEYDGETFDGRPSKVAHNAIQQFRGYIVQPHVQ